MKQQIDQMQVAQKTDQERIGQLESQIDSISLENEKLKMQLEAITKLQQTNSLRSQSSKVDSEVDSAWSNAQQYETDRSASVRKEEIINENSVRSSQTNSVSNPQCDDFYNPMPTRQFSKNYQPSLVFSKNSSEHAEL